MAWSPTMDLLAILTSQNISIFRPLSSNFENYLHKSPLKQFQFLNFCWRRDDIETNQFIFETILSSSSSIVHSCWTCCTNSTFFSSYQPHKQYLLLPPSCLPEYIAFTNTIQFPSQKDLETSSIFEQEILWNSTILCTLGPWNGKDEQSIECRALGTFLMGSINIKNISSPIEQIQLQSNLKYIICLLQNKQIMLLDVNDLIAKHWKQWYFVAKQWTNIDVPLNTHMKQIMEVIEKCWHQFFKQFLLILEELYDMTNIAPTKQTMFGIKTEKQEEEETFSKFSKVANCLLLILSIGTFDQPTLKWLSEVVTEQKMQRIIASMDLARKNITTCVMDYLFRYLDQIMFHLTSLKGFIVSDSKFSTIGIDSSSISQLIELVSTMVKEMKNYLTDLNEQCRQIRNFIDWIRETSAKVDNITKEEQQLRQQQFPISAIQIKELTTFLIHFPSQYMSISQQFKTLKTNLYPQLIKGFEQVFQNVTLNFSKYDSNLHKMNITLQSTDLSSIQSVKLFQDLQSEQLVFGVSIAKQFVLFSLLNELSYCIVELPDCIAKLDHWEWYTKDKLLLLWKSQHQEEKISLVSIPWENMQRVAYSNSISIPLNGDIITFIQELDSSRDFQYYSKNSNTLWLHTSTIRGLASVYSPTQKSISIFDLETPEEEEENEQIMQD